MTVEHRYFDATWNQNFWNLIDLLISMYAHRLSVNFVTKHLCLVVAFEIVVAMVAVGVVAVDAVGVDAVGVAAVVDDVDPHQN